MLLHYTLFNFYQNFHFAFQMLDIINHFPVISYYACALFHHPPHYYSIHIINPYPANVENMVAPTNASKWRMGFNSAFKGLT